MALVGRNAVVTGGASGIGRSIALRLAGEGLRVAILDLDGDGAERVGHEVRARAGSAVAVQVDVSRSADVARAGERVRGELGAVQVLVNDAGMCDFIPFDDMSEVQWERTLAVNLTSMFLCTRTFLPDMTTAGWGRIVNISSVAGLSGGGPSLVHYATSKAGVLGFTKALAWEVGPRGVTVNAIAPGLVDTPLIHKSRMPQAIVDYTVQRTPMRRVGTPEDIAAACAYLVSEEAGFVTGQVLSPNGGTYA
jgi:2-hydroxycyclohexanecarboxyl-CoA dehydrogenase